MACEGCNGNSPTSYSNPFSPCMSAPAPCGSPIDSSCIRYTGANLTCIEKDSNSSLESILQAIDGKVCEAIIIDWSSFDYFCVDDSVDIVNARDFVEAISEQFCTLKTTYNTFVDVTYVSDLEDINTEIDGIKAPALTSCDWLTITDDDTLLQVLTKIITGLCSVYDTGINPGDADWSQCHVVVSPPQNVTDGFDLIIDWICAIEASIGSGVTLPTFNNASSCLSITGATDSLYNTVVAIRTKLCSLPTFNIGNIDWTSCIPNPTGTLEDALNQMLSFLDNVNTLRVETFDPAFFDVSLVNPSDPCSGQVVTIKDGVGLTDKFVALNSGDTSPNYLLSKMTAGANMTFDTSTTPGTVILKATNNKVKADSGDTIEDYLINKISTIADAYNILSITKTYDATGDTVKLQPTVDMSLLASTILTTISENVDLLSVFCGMVCDCGDCETTTTTTAPRKIAFDLINEDGGDLNVGLTLSQNTPSLTWYNSASVSITASSTLSTGQYGVTSVIAPLIGNIIIDNANAFSLNYSVAVVDYITGVTVPSSGSNSGTLTTGGTATLSGFSFGTATYYRVKITLSGVHG